MKRILLIPVAFALELCILAQYYPVPPDSIPSGYFLTHSKAEWFLKASDLMIGISVDDSVPAAIGKIEQFILKYKPKPEYPDDIYAKESILQTIKSFKEGGYGIGAILLDADGNILSRNHNSQIQEHRSDLHAEMALLTGFEESQVSAKYLNLYLYPQGMTVYSSAEPCPMCLIRLASAGVNTKYICPGPEDGMASRIDCLPPSWQDLARTHPCVRANSSPVLQKIAHLMFFSYLLDDRGPK